MTGTREIELIVIYGICRVCGAARDVSTTEKTEGGFTTTTRALVCTADPTHSQDWDEQEAP